MSGTTPLLLFLASVVLLKASSTFGVGQPQRNCTLDSVLKMKQRLVQPFPLIGCLEYQDTLQTTVNESKPSYALIVIGPKDVGKSRGIQEMMEKWRKIGNFVLDINLKGQGPSVTTDVVMKSVSKEVRYFFYDISQMKSDCVHQATTRRCTGTLPPTFWSAVSTAFFEKFWLLCGTIIGACLGNVAFSWFTDPQQYKYLKIIIKTVCVALLTIATMLYLVYIFIPFDFHEFFLPINVTISTGSWATLMCTLNYIAVCVPEQRPILIIRELTNLDSNSMTELLVSLERFKENGIQFPVIIETSDFLWMDQIPKKSFSSFLFHYMTEVSYSEGLNDLVSDLEWFTEEEYSFIYKNLGGHVGSYVQLFRFIVLRCLSLELAMQELINESFGCVSSCISGYHTEAFNFLVEWNEKKRYGELPDIAKKLIKCNILIYRHAFLVLQPQNKLMALSIQELKTMYK